MNGLYVSNDEGNTNNFSHATSASNNTYIYAYRDFMVDEGTTELILTFDWKAMGNRAVNDFIRVYFVDPTTNIVGGEHLPNGLDASAQIGNYSGGTGEHWLSQESTWQQAEFRILADQFASLAGNRWRLVIHWRNEHHSSVTQANNPAATVDNIVLAAPACPMPTATTLVSTNEAATEAVVTFTDELGYEWILQHKQSSDDTWNSAHIYETTYTIADLMPNTSYNVRVSTFCSEGDTSDWSNTLTFTTPCAALTVPTAIETFTAVPPGCWTRKSGMLPTEGTIALTNPSTSWNLSYTNLGENITTSHAKFNVYSANSPHWLISPTINLGNDGAVSQVEFDVQLTGYNTTAAPAQSSDDRFAVVVSTDNGATWAAANATIWSTEETAERNFNDLAEQQHVIIALQDAMGDPYQGLVKIGIYGESTVTGPDSDLHIDNFVVLPYSDCNRPTGLSISNITGTEATVNFVEHGTATSWEYVISSEPTITNPDEGTPNTLSEIGETITNLSPLTTYTLWLRSNCGSSTSIWTDPVTFSTNAVSATLPFSCDFENGEENANWILVNGTTANQWHIGSSLNSDSVNTTMGGSNGLYVSNDNGDNNNYTLAANSSNNTYIYAYRDVEIGEGVTELTLTFDWKAMGNSAVHDFLRVYFVDPATGIVAGQLLPSGLDASGQIGNYSGGEGEHWLSQQSTWQQAAFNISTAQFPELAGNTWRLLFHWRNDFDAANEFAANPAGTVDNVVLQAATCSAPTELSLLSFNTEATQAEVSFMSTDATEWTLEYKEDGSSTWNSEVTNNTTHTITGLTPNTAYNVRVRANCAASDISNWSTTLNFSTPCAALMAPTAVETFNSVTPTCWEEKTGILPAEGNVVFTQNSSRWEMNSANLGGNITDNHAKVNIYYINSYEWLISPSINLGDGTNAFQVEFDVQLTAYNTTNAPEVSNDDRFAVVISLDNGATWSAANATVWAHDDSSPQGFMALGTQQHVVVELVDDNEIPYSGVVKVGLYTESLATEPDNDLHIDNFIVNPLGTITPDCDTPINISASDITSNEATLTWTPSTETAWQVRLGENGDVMDVTSSPTYTFTALIASMEYTAYVRANCGDGVYSDWGSTTFTTSEVSECPAPTNIAAVSESYTSITVSWVGESNEYNIRHREGTSGAWSNNTATQSPYTIEDLEAGTSYQIQVQSVCGEEVSTWAPEAPITATTMSQMFSIIATAHGPGTINPSGTSQYNGGAMPTYEFTPNANALVDSVRVSGVITPFEENSYTFPALTQNEILDVFFSIPSNIQERELANIVSLYPNPATASITIQATDVTISQVEILDMTGRTVTIIAQMQNTINIQSLETGIYFARITTEKGEVTLRFIKQ